MSDSHSTPPAAPGKPSKPYPEYPLTAHPAGYWAKKIRGKTHYFGPWSDPDAALAKYFDERDDLHAGRTPRPSKKVLRLARNERGTKMFEEAEVRALLAEAGVQLKAMILLGVNCGFGNADVGTLPLSALDLNSGWVSYPRPKTGVTRRCWLWP